MVKTILEWIYAKTFCLSEHHCISLCIKYGVKGCDLMRCGIIQSKKGGEKEHGTKTKERTRAK